MKTTVRCTIILPDNYARVQRLYDHRTWFTLEEEIITEINRLTWLIEGMNSKGGKIIDNHQFIDDDDLKEKTCIVYEYITG